LRGANSNNFDDNSNSVHGYAHRTLAVLSITLLFSTVGISLPSLVAVAAIGSPEGVLRLSHWVCIVLLVFSAVVLLYIIKKWRRYSRLDDQQFSERLKLGPITSTILAIITLGVLCFQSYSLALSIQPVSMNWGITRTFAGAVLLPVATQASSHITSARQTLNLSLFFSLTSLVTRCLSLVLWVAPLLVMISWGLSTLRSSPLEDFLSLDFGVVPIVTVLLSAVFHVFISTAGIRLINSEDSYKSVDTADDDDDEDEEDSLGGSSARRKREHAGKSIVWLIGAAMLALYVIMVIVFFYHP